MSLVTKKLCGCFLTECNHRGGISGTISRHLQSILQVSCHPVGTLDKMLRYFDGVLQSSLWCNYGGFRADPRSRAGL